MKQSEIEAYRLYEKDIPEFPYIVDVYAQHFIVYEKGKKLAEDEQEMRQHKQQQVVDALIELFSTSENFIHFKSREIQKGLNQYEKTEDSSEIIIIKEGDAKFKINLTDYLDTGLFLDHRPIRKEIYKVSHGKSLLNLFSYTCSVSVFAAMAGANVTSVDLSNTYLNWGRENFSLNDINPSKHQFIKMDCIKYLKECRSKFDIIFIDPPSFSNSKSVDGTFDVQRDHTTLINIAMNLIRPNGSVYFSNNFRNFKLAPELESNFQVQDITARSIPNDFRDKKIHKCFEIKTRV
ncbi:class I SAM-dependent methyltransferase [Bacteriovoracaceae bacterium]|nr:class I SAM-dependent methyltransferase [Bacteriovoracaceae bacterium]